MAKIKFKQNFENGLEDFQDLSLKVKQKGEVAVWTDTETGATIKLEGKNFAISSENEDYLSAGTVKSATLTDGDGKLFVSATDLNLKATKLMAAYEAGGSENVAFYVAKGDDIVLGSKQDDYIIGGAGDDVMTGGAGRDMFYFHAQMIWEEQVLKTTPEHDIITDFDWKGDDSDQLQYLGEYKYKAVDNGADTRLKFEDGSTLILDGVKVAQFEKWLDNGVVDF